MADWDDVRELALALPETVEETSHGQPSWTVAGKTFLWERPLRKRDVADLQRLGQDVPTGPILGARVADESVKHALVADDPAVFFTVPHFDGYNAVLIRLDTVDAEELQETVIEAWLSRAPKKVAKQFLDG